MKKFTVLLVLSFTSFFGNNCGILLAQWLPQTAPTGVTSLNSVFAISPSAVACAGYQRVIRSLDSGQTWTQPIGLGSVNINTVHSGISTSWLSLCSNSGWKVKINNPGGVALSSGPDSILALHFNTPGCASAVGLNGKVETTCDSGATWQVRVFSGLTLNSVWYADANTGIACGVFGGIKRTLNGGATWATVTCPVTQNLNGVTFADSLTGYIVGNTGTFLKTIDGGASWTSMPLGISNTINGVYFVSADTGYVVGTAGLIKKTVDGGVTWSTMVSGTTQILRSVHFANSVSGWVVGDGAVIRKYCPTLSVSGTISGNTTVCAGDTVSYSITAVSGAINYTWNLPTGWVWVSSSTSNTITMVTGNSSGTITVSANNACGSGTPVTLAVTVNPPPVPLITQTATILTSSVASGNQWYLNGVSIAGATGQSYSYTLNGTYSVIATYGSCSSESAPLVVTNAAINELEQYSPDFTIYPNPTSGLFELAIINPLQREQTNQLIITISDVVGKVILHSLIVDQHSTIDLLGISKGIYFIQLKMENKNGLTRKIIID